jgi:hypothetical protein
MGPEACGDIRPDFQGPNRDIAFSRGGYDTIGFRCAK